MPNVSPKKYDRSFNMKVDDEFLEALDRVRNSERPVLTRSDYLRKAVFESLVKLERKK